VVIGAKNDLLAKANTNLPETEIYVGTNRNPEEKDTTIKQIRATPDISLIG
jgi:hypothetical protein